MKKLNAYRSNPHFPRLSKSALYLALAVTPAVTLLTPQTSHAATDTWNGAGLNALWSNPANWGGIAVNPLDSLIFAGTTDLAPSNDFPVGTPFGSITFAPSAGNFTLGGKGIVLGDSPFNGGAAIDPTNYSFNLANYFSLINSASGLQTVNIPLTLSALSSTASSGGFHIINGGAGGLAISGTLTRTLGSTADFSGTISTTSANDATGIIGGWATFNNTDLAAVVGGQVVAYTGYTQITGAPVIPNTAGANVQWNSATGSATLASTTTNDINSLTYTGTTSHTITMTASQTLRLGATGTIFRTDGTTNTVNSLIIGNTAGVGVLTAGGAPNTAGEIIFNVNDNAGTVSSAQNTDDVLVNASITDNGTGKVTVVKTGLGSVKFGTKNTFTGDIYVNEGRIRNTDATGWTSGGGTVYVANGAQAYIQVLATVASNIDLAGIGVEEGGAGTFVGGAMRLAANGTVYNGNITLTANARITARGSVTGSTINGTITGAYQLESGGAATGLLILAGTGDNYTGGTLISSGTTKLGANEVIPNGVGKGNLIMNGDGLSAGVTIFDLNGHSETVNGLASGLTTSTANITNSAAGASILTVGDNNATASYSGIITDSGATKSVGITKIGTGTQTLAGANTYVGPTTISGGTLSLTSTGSINNTTSITIAAGATFDTSALNSYTIGNGQTLINNGGTLNTPFSIQGTGVISGALFGTNISIDGGNVNPGANGTIGVVGTTTFGSLTISSGQENVDALGAGDKVVVTGALNLNGTLNIAVDPNAVAGTYTILQYGSLTGGGSFALPVTSSGGINYSLSTVGNTLKLTVSGAIQTLTWSGAADGTTWDIQNTQNWLNGSTPATYIDGSNVVFNDSNNGHYAVNIATQVSPNSMVVNNSAGDYSIGGSPIAGATSIVKSGASALTLTSANSYTGGTFMNGGTLNLAASGADSTGPLTIAAGTVNIAAAGAIGTGILTINGGTLDNTSGAVINLTSSAIVLGGSFTYNGTQALDFGAGNVTLGANITITVNGSPTTGLEIDSTISGGANGFVKAGPGTLTLFNVLPAGNLFSGPVDIQNGAVLGEIAGAIGTGTITLDPAGILVLGDQFANKLILNGGTLGSDDTAGSTSNITVNAGTNTTILAGDPLVLTASKNMSWTGVLSGSGNLTIKNVTGNGSTTGFISPDGSQALRINTTNASTFSGNITVVNGSKLELFATVAGTNTPIGTGTVFLTAGDAALGNSVLANTTTSGYSEFNLRNNTTGNVTFPNNVVITGTGLTVINPLGTAATGVSASMNNLTIGSGQTLAVYFSSALDHPVGFASVTLASSGATFAPQLPGFGNASAAGSDLILGSISEATPGSGFAMSGLRKLILTGNNTFTGGIALNSGTIQLASAGAFPAATHTPFTFGNPTTSTTGTLDLNGFSAVVGGLTDLSGTTANIITNTAPTTTSTLTFSTGTSTFAGIIQDGTASGGGITALSVTSGNLTLASANTYTGNTTLNGGALYVNNSLASASVILNGGTLGGNGAITAAITPGTAAHTIAPGAAPGAIGTLTVGGLSTTANTTLSFDLASPTGTSDLLAVAGNITLAGGKLAITSQSVTGSASLGYYKVISYSGTLTGSISGIVLPAVASNIKYTLDTLQNPGFIDIHRGYMGDANDDGQVNATDLQIVLNNLGTTTSSWGHGNFDGAATIDLNDLNAVLNNLGTSIPIGAVLVSEGLAADTAVTPEPASLGLLAFGAVALLSRRRRS